jgi:hypothetical protein
MVGFAAFSGRMPKTKANTEAGLVDIPQFEHVNWRTQPNMKKRGYTLVWCRMKVKLTHSLQFTFTASSFALLLPPQATMVCYNAIQPTCAELTWFRYDDEQ